MAEQFPQPIEELMSIAWTEAKDARAEAVEPIHLLIAVCKQNLPPIERALAAVGLDPVKLRRRVRGFARALGARQNQETRRVSGRIADILQAANAVAASANRKLLVTDVMLHLLASTDVALKAVVEGEQLPVSKLRDALQAEADKPDAPKAEARAAAGGGTLEKLGKDYTQLAREGKLDPVIGRRDELKQMIRVLLRKQKNNPVLVGEAGVGKTSIVEGLAAYAVSEHAPPEVRTMQIIEVQIASLVAGAKYRGDLEQRLQDIVAAAEADPNIVIFIDEIHMIVGAGSGGDAMDAANILKPALARGAMRCIGATTPAEYARYIEKDAALERRFQPIRVEEPTPAEAREILAGLRASYEKYHQVKITDDALDAAVSLSVKYIPDRRLPDKARDLLDQAAVARRVRTLSPVSADDEGTEITREDIAAVVAEWTGIPVEKLTASERDRLAKIEETLRKRVVGQDHAIDAVARVVRTALSGLAPANRPYGVFLFTGPTGVGKTELAKALAQFLFDDERRLLRFDMSEYMEEHSVSKLIGSPPGYVGHEEGGRLTDAVRHNPYSVVLFDELEKAHPKVADLFLQIFDDGRLTDSHGRTADFRNTIIILTSNVSTAMPQKSARVGFKQAGEEESKEVVADPRAALMGRFRPELLNRLSAIVPFNALSIDHARAIVDKALGNVRKRLGDRRIELRVTDAGYDALVTAGFHPQFGARELERVVEREVVQPLAQGIVAGKWRDGSAVTVDADGPRIRVRTADDDQVVSGAVLKTLLQPAAEEEVTLFLVDIVKSTRMLMDAGDTGFVRHVRNLHSLLNEESVRFLKGTGDGFLVIYPDLSAAVSAADRIRQKIADDSISIRIVIHAGRVKVGPGGDPLGREVHRLFRLESTEAAKKGGMIMSEPAVQRLPVALRDRFKRAGEFHLEGFDEPEGVWVEG